MIRQCVSGDPPVANVTWISLRLRRVFVAGVYIDHMIRVLEDLMIRLIVPGLLGFASFVAALVAVSQFIAALPSNPAALSIAQWDPGRLATAGISGGFA